ncbi:MAG: PD-(D/E)XK nuclease family protein [Acidobacteriota bacterium]
MPSLRFAPYRDIASEVATRLLAAREGRDPLTPWEEEVLVPSRGVAEAIAREMLNREPSGLAGLQLQSLESLAVRILSDAGQTPRVAEEAERRLAMRTAARGIDDPLLSSRGVAGMLERSYRDMRDSGFTLAQFTRRVEEARGLRNAPRTRLALRAWTEYERWISQVNAIDPADLLQRASRLVGEFVRPQLLAGFYDMTGAQRRFLDALLRADRVAAIWVPSSAPFAQPFVQSLREDVDADSGSGKARDSSPARTVTQSDTRLEEMQEVCSQVAILLAAGTNASEIGIVARSLEPYDARLLHRFAAQSGFAITLGEEIPLAAHRIGRGALTLLRLRERGFPRTSVLGLVRDGLRTQTRLDVDAADAETRRARIAGGTSEELRRRRIRSAVIDAYIELVAELEILTASINLPLLARLGSLFRVETEADLAAAEELDEVAALFRRFGTAALPDVLDAIEQGGIRAQDGPGAQGPLIWCGEVPRFRGRSFAHLFAIRMQDDVFPQRRTEDPLLPDSDRRILGLREIGDGREEEQLLFSLLSESAGVHVHFSFASGDGFGKVLRPSRFVRSLPAEDRIAPLAHPEPGIHDAQRDRQLQLLVRAGTRSAFDGYVPGIDPSTLRLSPTQLEDFGECPQKFLLKHVLGVRDIDQPEREIQIHHRDKGTLDHKILERFYRSLTEDELHAANAALPQLPVALGERLEEFVDDQFDEHEGDVPPFNRTVRDIERRATKRILREFVIHDLADLQTLDLVPRWFEYRFGAKHRQLANHPEPFIVDVDGVPVRVEGTIDRIDVGRVSTNHRIVDYKSGKALRHANLGDKIDRGVRLQLALYAMSVSSFFELDSKDVSATIKPLVTGDVKPASFAFALEEKREGLLETLRIFIRAITAGTFPAFPNEKDTEFNSCKYCPVNHSCRTKHDLDERYAVQQQKDPRTLLGAGL